MRAPALGWLLTALLGSSPAWAADVQTERHKILAPDGETDHFFGRSVALRGDHLLVGADGDDQNGSRAGAAYVFRAEGGGWAEVAKLLAPASATSASDLLGNSVCFAGNGEAVVAAPSSDPFGWRDPQGGSLEIFRGPGWGHVRQLTHPIPSSGLGWDLGCSQDRIIAGAPYTDGDLAHQGSVSIFRLDGSDWVPEAYFLPGSPRHQGYLGWSVATDGLTAVASAPGREPDDVTVYRRSAAGWHVDAVLGSLEAQDVAVAGDLMIAASQAGDGSTEGSGVVRVFRRVAGAWSETAVLESDRPATGNFFGRSVALDGDRLVVGEMYADHAGPDHGAVHVFRIADGQWRRERIFVASDGFERQGFGDAVALESRRVAVGAVLDDELGSRAGAVYDFALPFRIEIDLWPYRDRRRLDPTGPGILPVALLGSASFEASDVAADALAFGPAGASPLALLPARDLDADGFDDRIALFRTREAGIAFGDTQACLAGTTPDGDAFEGCAPIETIHGCGHGHEIAWLAPVALVLGRRRRRPASGARATCEAGRSPTRPR